MKELLERLEKAKKELAKFYEMHDWDGIETWSLEVYTLQREVESYES